MSFFNPRSPKPVDTRRKPASSTQTGLALRIRLASAATKTMTKGTTARQ